MGKTFKISVNIFDYEVVEVCGGQRLRRKSTGRQHTLELRKRGDSMKKDGLFIIVVKRPEDTNWILYSDVDGLEYKLAVEHLAECVKRFGEENAWLAKRVHYTVDVKAHPIGMKETVAKE